MPGRTGLVSQQERRTGERSADGTPECRGYLFAVPRDACTSPARKDTLANQLWQRVPASLGLVDLCRLKPLRPGAKLARNWRACGDDKAMPAAGAHPGTGQGRPTMRFVGRWRSFVCPRLHAVQESRRLPGCRGVSVAARQTSGEIPPVDAPYRADRATRVGGAGA